MEDRDLYTLPPGLPVPEDDGAADHLPGTELPQLVLESDPELRLRDLLGLPTFGAAGSRRSSIRCSRRTGTRRTSSRG